MRNASICLLAGVLALTGCKKEKEVTVTETRPLTTFDVPPKLFATSNERFRDEKPSPVTATTPQGWLEQPGSQFRTLNYRFGQSGAGEAYVTIAMGSVLDNVNRWLKQFNVAPLDVAGIEKLRHVMISGGEGVWVQAEGTYDSGMAMGGAEPKTGYALEGVIAMVDGKTLTVKMVGPKEEVAEAKAALETYITTVRLTGAE